MKAVFFYGLFMDESLLKEKGFHPTAPELAYVEGFGLRIGERATLFECAGQRSYGTIMSLSEDELGKLYSGPGVGEYIPENVTAHVIVGGTRSVLSYNLPRDKLIGKNREYAKSLTQIATKVGLPESYIIEINSWSK